MAPLRHRLLIQPVLGCQGASRLLRRFAGRVLVSACQPKFAPSLAVNRIRPYWDGGHLAKPAAFPVFYEYDSTDVLLVLLSPFPGTTPCTPWPSPRAHRETGLNAYFMREMQPFFRATFLAAPLFIERGRLKHKLQVMPIHMSKPGHVRRGPRVRMLQKVLISCRTALLFQAIPSNRWPGATDWCSPSS